MVKTNKNIIIQYCRNWRIIVHRLKSNIKRLRNKKRFPVQRYVLVQTLRKLVKTMIKKMLFSYLPKKKDAPTPKTVIVVAIQKNKLLF